MFRDDPSGLVNLSRHSSLEKSPSFNFDSLPLGTKLWNFPTDTCVCHLLSKTLCWCYYCCCSTSRLSWRSNTGWIQIIKCFQMFSPNSSTQPLHQSLREHHRKWRGKIIRAKWPLCLLLHCVILTWWGSCIMKYQQWSCLNKACIMIKLVTWNFLILCLEKERQFPGCL